MAGCSQRLRAILELDVVHSRWPWTRAGGRLQRPCRRWWWWWWEPISKGCVSRDHDAFPAASSFMDDVFGPARLLTKNRPVQRRRKICCASIGPANGTGVAASRQSEASRSRSRRRGPCGPRYGTSGEWVALDAGWCGRVDGSARRRVNRNGKGPCNSVQFCVINSYGAAGSGRAALLLRA